MPQTMSVTEARDNFPALVRRVAEQNEPVIVTSHNQPKAVLLRWETYQIQQQIQSEGAQVRLEREVAAMEQLTATMLENFRPQSIDMEQAIQDLARLAYTTWETCQLLERPRRHLATLLTNVLQNIREQGSSLTEEQLRRLLATIGWLRQEQLTNEMVASVDRSLLQVGLRSILPMDEKASQQYLALIEEPL